MKKKLFFAFSLLAYLPVISQNYSKVNTDLSMHSKSMLIDARNDADGMRESMKEAFIVKGKVTGLNTGYVYLSFTDSEGKYRKDSCRVKNSEFKFEGKISYPQMAYFNGPTKSRAMDDPNWTSFFLEPSLITIVAKINDFKNARITGSKSQEEYAELQRLKAPVFKEMEPLSKAYEASNKAYSEAVKAKKDEAVLEDMKNKAAAIHEQFGPYHKRASKVDYDFFSNHPQSYVTAFNLRFYVNDLPLDSLQMFYDNLGPAVQQSAIAKELAKEIEQLRWGSPGSIAKDFTTTDINGNKISLSDLKGKYVLLDFWASWCVPCRKGNPHLKELYAKYKDKGIEFIGVSDDDSNPDAWRKAVEKDGLSWRHILRGLDVESLRKGIRMDNPNDISDKFGIHSLPTKILIDKDGKIIGRYSEEEGPLDKMLVNIFGS